MGCMEQYEDEFDVCPYCGYLEGTKPEQALHMEPGSILQERFIVGKSIGYGGFGVTYIGWDALLEHRVAIKEYLPSEFSTRMPGVTQVTVFNGDKSEQFRDGLRQFVQEAKKLAKFNNVEGIVKIYDSFEENNTAYIVMEYLEGETLAQRLEREKTIDPDEAIAMLTPVIESLEKVHEQGIIHRDIAPDNLFITKNGGVKVIDFGAARFATTSHSRSLTVIIKPGFSPEEQYRSRKEQGGYTDVYAIGATLYKMITGITPPDALERYAMAEGKNKDILEPIAKHCKTIDQNQENAILNALNIRIEDRTPTMAALLGELKSEVPVKRIYGRIKRTDTLRWPLWAKISVPVVAVLLLVFGVLWGTGVIGFKSDLQTQIQIPEGMTRVPSVVNNTTETAETRLAEAILLYTIAGKEYSAVVPADYVLSQDMVGGIVVQQNSIVNIVISGGAETVTVPHVANMTFAKATVLLEDAGFVVSKIETFSNAIEVDHVIAQDVEANTELTLGSVITLTVSKGVDPDATMEKTEIVLQDFVGKTYDELLGIAEANGFKIEVSDRQFSTEYAANTIMKQSPEAGTTITTGDTVTVVVSAGKETIKVPDVQYKEKTEAKAVLETLGLKVTIKEVESETVGAGLVISQSVDANAMVDPGTNITLTVSKGAASFAMPSVVGKTEADAKRILTGKGLSVSVTYEYSTKASGTVLKQSISEDSQVTRGAAVTITVSSGEKTISVPNVVSQTQKQAESALKDKGFAVTVNKVYSDTVAEGIVISQTPSGGSSQVKGSTVILTVSLGKDTVQSISIATKPNKVNYFVGETLNPAGISLTAKRESGSTQTVTGGFTCNPTVLNAAGSQTITVTYEGCTTTFQVSVSDIVLDSISIKTKPTKTSYYVGDALNTSGLVLTAKYSNGSTQELTSGFTCTPTTLSTEGTQTITVRYQSKSCTFTVSVAPVIEVTSVRMYCNGQLLSNKLNERSVRKGNTLQCTAEIAPQNATDKAVTWSSSDPTVATIDNTGKITGLSIGETTITATAVNGIKWSMKLGVYEPTIAVAISLSTHSVTDTYEGQCDICEFGNDELCYHPGNDIKVKYKLNLHNQSPLRSGIDEVVIDIGENGMILQNVSGAGSSGIQSGRYITITNTEELGDGVTRTIYFEVLCKTPSVAQDFEITIKAEITKAHLEDEPSSDYVAHDGGDTDKETLTIKACKIEEVANGSCGSNIIWKLTNNGVLTISGSGAMQNYSIASNDNNYAPWHDYLRKIQKISLSSGITSIGQGAFAGCSNITSFTIPSTVQNIGQYAFWGCSNITTIKIPSSVSNIEKYAFAFCDNLQTITIMNPNCEMIEDVGLPPNCVIRGYYGSNALLYAMIGDYTFEAID